MRIYRVKYWDAKYENNRSRKITDLRWVPIPNSHDGESYTTLISRTDAAMIFSAWILILQVASKCTPRGLLRRSDGTPHTPPSLSTYTRAPEAWFLAAFPVLEGLQWIESEPFNAENVTRMTSQTSPERQAGDEEGKGMEGIEKNASPPAAVVLPWDSDAFKSAWMDFKDHRKAKKSPMTFKAEQLTLKKLQAMGEHPAIRSIENSIANGWKGVFDPPAPNGGKLHYAGPNI